MRRREAAIVNWRRIFSRPDPTAEQRAAGGLNLLDLRTRPRRRHGLYWASVIVSIAAHGGFLVYLLAFARFPAQPPPRPRATGVNVEVIGPRRFEALRRSDREKLPAEIQAELSEPPALAGEGVDQRDPGKPGTNPAAEAADLASLLGPPLPEDRARAVEPPSSPDHSPARRPTGTPPAPLQAVANPVPQAGPAAAMKVPARRLAQIAREIRLSELRAGLRVDYRRPVPDAAPLPPLKLLVMPEQANAAPAPEEERRVSSPDMGPQGRPVVAELPREAGTAMFAARIPDDPGTLPEDRSVKPAPPARTDIRLAPPKRPAALKSRSARAGQGPRPAATGSKDADGIAAPRIARAYRSNIRAHLTANRPAGRASSGRAVVAFRVTPQGGVRSVRIVRSSGSAPLDQSVLQAVYRAAPFPKPPQGLKPDQLRFVIPFEFR